MIRPEKINFQHGENTSKLESFKLHAIHNIYLGFIKKGMNPILKKVWQQKLFERNGGTQENHS